MNLWKWSYYCLNHDGICCFFRKLKTTFLDVKSTMPWKTQLLQPLDVPLYLHVRSLSWPWSVWQPEMSLSGSCWVLGAFSVTHGLHAMADKWCQLPSPMGTCCSSHMDTPGHEWLVLGCASRKRQKKCVMLSCFVVTIRTCPNVQKWKKETIKCGGCRVGLGSFPHSVQLGCEVLLECLLLWLWNAVRVQGWASSCPGSAPSQAQASIHITWVTLIHEEQKVSLWVIAEPSRMSIDTPKWSLNFVCSVTSRMSCRSKNLFWARIPSWKRIKHWGNLIRPQSAVPSLGRWQSLGCSFGCELGYFGKSCFQ